MSINKDLKRMNDLVIALLEHNKRYHQDDAPVISDQQYDALLVELRELEEKYPFEVNTALSPNFNIGYVASERFRPVKHKWPMQSINNIFSKEGLLEYTQKIGVVLKQSITVDGRTFGTLTPRFALEVKYDGLALDLQYVKYGNSLKLDKAVTRGDGETGEDVTHAVKGISGIPLHIPAVGGYEELDIRGEVLMSYSNFEALNASLIAANQKPRATPRNAAAGIVRSFDPEDSNNASGVEFVAYGVGWYGEAIKNFHPKTHIAMMENLELWGFNTESSYRQEANSIADVLNYYDLILKERDNMRFPIDGFVVKVNHYAAQHFLGYSSRAPRFMTALKYPAEEAVTLLEDITVQVGRTGAITPVGRLAGVLVGGVIVTNSTLHNVDEINRKNLMIGDQVIVRRAGDVIPEIVGPVDATKRNGTERYFVMPKHCPCCDTEIVREQSNKVFRCTNEDCSGRIVSKLIHAYSRDALDIRGIGDKTIEAMVDDGMLEDIADIYRINHSDLLHLPGIKKKTADNIMASIEKSRKTTLDRVIFALGIRHVGKSTAKTLANHMGSMASFYMNAADLNLTLGLKDIGPSTAAALHDFMLDPVNADLVEALAHHLNIAEAKLIPLAEANEMAGDVVVVTGSFSGQTRSEIEDKLLSRGAKVTGTVSKKTTMLLAGENPSAAKVSKAKELNISIVNVISF